MSIFQCFCIILAAAFVLEEVAGHGYMWDPVMRSSRWRNDTSAPKNYNDNELFCGGVGIQWEQNKGKCGVCGDSYNLAVPRPNENTGTYGNGVAVKTYTAGSEIPVYIKLVANHKGWFSYSLCDLKDASKPETEECFKPLQLASGSDRFEIKPTVFEYTNTVILPPGQRCQHCVLRWTYKTGNSWGTCEDGTGAMGCGAQETYKNCADIIIN